MKRFNEILEPREHFRIEYVSGAVWAVLYDYEEDEEFSFASPASARQYIQENEMYDIETRIVKVTQNFEIIE